MEEDEFVTGAVWAESNWRLVDTVRRGRTFIRLYREKTTSVQPEKYESQSDDRESL